MADVSQLDETETSCDVSIVIPNDPTGVEQRTMPKQKVLRGPRHLLQGTAEVSQLTETETSYHVPIAMQNDRISLEQKLTLPWTLPSQKIRRVPRQLLEVNRKAYEPYVISIGPYHRGKDHLKEMEGHKVHSLNRLLQSTNQSVEIYLSAIDENMVKELRNCYSEPLEISDQEFVEMMVLDGCFIIQFFMGKLEDSFHYRGMIYSSILHDLVLVENQLPFFVLCKLLDIMLRLSFNFGGSTDPKSIFIHMILEAFEWKMPGLRVNKTYSDNLIKEVKHLVHLLSSNWLPSDNAMKEYHNIDHPKDRNWSFIRSATELREAGIELKGGGRNSLFDIKFENKILEIPTVTIGHDTDSLFRNLIVCEQYDREDPLFLTAYVTLMDHLINSEKDVELLRKSGIIDNLLGNDESVAALFNRLGDHIVFSIEDSFYAQLFKEIDEHYGTAWNAWKANLRHKYFKTPSAFISFLAATLLLLLTVLQTAFTIFPWS